MFLKENYGESNKITVIPLVSQCYDMGSKENSKLRHGLWNGGRDGTISG